MTKKELHSAYIHQDLLEAIESRNFVSAGKIIFNGREIEQEAKKIYAPVNLFGVDEFGNNLFHLLATHKKLTFMLVDAMFVYKESIWKRESRDHNNANNDLVTLLSETNSNNLPAPVEMIEDINPSQLFVKFAREKHYIKYIIGTKLDYLTIAASASGKAKGWDVLVFRDSKSYVYSYVQQLKNKYCTEKTTEDSQEEFIVQHLGFQVVKALIDYGLLQREEYNKAVKLVIAKQKKFIEASKEQSSSLPKSDLDSAANSENRSADDAQDVLCTEVTDSNKQLVVHENLDIQSIENKEFINIILPIIYKATKSYSKQCKDKFTTNILESIEVLKKVEQSFFTSVKYFLHLAIYLDHNKTDHSVSFLQNYLLQIAKGKYWQYHGGDSLKDKFYQCLIEQTSYDDLSFVHNKSVALDYAIRVDNVICTNYIVNRLEQLQGLSSYKSLIQYKPGYVFKYGSVKTLEYFLNNHPNMLSVNLINDYLYYQKNILTKNASDLNKSIQCLNILREYPEILLSIDTKICKKLYNLYKIIEQNQGLDKYHSYKTILLEIFAHISEYKQNINLKEWVKAHDRTITFPKITELFLSEKKTSPLLIMPESTLDDIVNNHVDCDESTIGGSSYTAFTDTERSTIGKIIDDDDNEIALGGSVH